jgi:hypothetical protein
LLRVLSFASFEDQKLSSETLKEKSVDHSLPRMLQYLSQTKLVCDKKLKQIYSSFGNFPFYNIITSNKKFNLIEHNKTEFWVSFLKSFYSILINPNFFPTLPPKKTNVDDFSFLSLELSTLNISSISPESFLTFIHSHYIDIISVLSSLKENYDILKATTESHLHTIQSLYSIRKFFFLKKNVIIKLFAFKRDSVKKNVVCNKCQGSKENLIKSEFCSYEIVIQHYINSSIVNQDICKSCLNYKKMKTDEVNKLFFFYMNVI